VSKKSICSRVPVAVALIIVVLALSPSAFAAGSVQSENGGNVSAAVQGGSKSRSPAAAATEGSAGLPFSALDITLLLGGGGLLVGSGVLFGRLRSRRGTA
jgi:hypothetical protein